MQDRKGYIWIGTQTGLQRYDGKRYTNYLADVHDKDALHSDWISALYEDSKHRLWVGTSLGGACLFNRNTGKFYNYNTHLTAGNKKTGGIWQFLEDRQGVIWIAAYDGYHKLNAKTNQFESVRDLLKMGNTILPGSITMDKTGDLWFATTGGVKKLDTRKNILTDKNNNPLHEAIFDIKESIANIVFDKKGNIWVGTGYERLLYRYRQENNKLYQYSFNRLGTDEGPSAVQQEFIGNPLINSKGDFLLPLLSRGIGIYNYQADSFAFINANNNSPHGLHLNLNSFGPIYMMEDKEKNIWIGDDKGINIFNLETPPFATYGLPENTFSSTSSLSEVSDFLQTSDDDVYVSHYYENGGISRFDKSLKFKKKYLAPFLPGKPEVNQLWNLFQDAAGIIWAPTQAGNILLLNPKNDSIRIYADSLLSGSINQVLQDADKNIWIAHNRKGLIKIDGITKKISKFTEFADPVLSDRKRAMCLMFDEDKIWVGTILNGLQLFDKKSGRFEYSFVMNESSPQSISNNNIIGILPLNQDTLIIATQGGIDFFDKRKKMFTSITSKDGLPNNLTQAIILDDNKNLWTAFAGGLSKIDLHNGSITNFDETDGIIDNRFNNRFVKLHDGQLMIGASESFLVFNPLKMEIAKKPEDVTITGFKVFGKAIMIDTLLNTAEPITLPYQHNSFHIEFASLQFNSINKIKYFYQLEGVDKNYVMADGEMNAHYNQLAPGRYLFKIKCANREGVFCNNITTLSIHIIPPFWRTWWFISLVVLVLLFCLLAVIKWRERNIRLIETGKTTLQQLTAEKYKTQFEAEQISSFFTTSLFNKNDVDDVLWDVAKNLIGKLGFVDCMIYLWNEDKTKMIQKAGYGPKGSLEQLEKHLFDVLPGQGVVGAVMASGEPILIPDTSLDKRYRIDDIDRLSEICVPIKYNEQLVGVIDSEHHERNFFTRQHLQVLSTIATLVASKINSIESEQRLRHQKAELADINQQLAEVQLAALRSQMNPHFIFNALNSIKKFVIANEPDNAEKYLGKFSKLIRLILDNSQTGMVSVEKELKLLKLYLDLEQLRFGQKLKYSIEVDEKIEPFNILIPSMIVQPFVENAMLHGIMHREDGGLVTVQFLLHTSWLQITIEDNGVGRENSARYKSDSSEHHHSIGIEVATKRLLALKKNEATPAGIHIVDLRNDNGEGIGTKVVISIPIE